MMQPNTHLHIDTSLCGKVTKLEQHYAEVVLHTTRQMAADERGLVHGGFVFGAADYAAMCAVNDPYVVLGASTSKFITPVKVGDVVVCKASVTEEKGKKRTVKVDAFVAGKRVFEGSFTTFVLEKHVLDG
jgi:acyl-coenzyme A thioesterase PaaI-like protein